MAKEITNLTAVEGAPFSNSDMGYGWMASWCDVCVHDAPSQRDEPDAEGCPLVLFALIGQTPDAWTEEENEPYTHRGQYTCSEFERE